MYYLSYHPSTIVTYYIPLPNSTRVHLMAAPFSSNSILGESSCVKISYNYYKTTMIKLTCSPFPRSFETIPHKTTKQ